MVGSILVDENDESRALALMRSLQTKGGKEQLDFHFDFDFALYSSKDTCEYLTISGVVVGPALGKVPYNM